MGNLNLGNLECLECENTFSCRIGLSNRSEQELNLSCKECGAVSSFNISGMKDLSMDGVKKSLSKPSYHVDLHLDFPVFEHETYPWISPFMMSNMMGGGNVSKHAHNMHLLNIISDNINEIKNTLGFYLKKKYKPFLRNVSSYLEMEIEAVNLNDVQAELLLFKYLTGLIEPFNSIESTNDSIEEYLKKIKELSEKSSPALNSFISEIFQSKFIEHSIKDAVKIYKKILSKEVIFRPSLFLDHIDSDEGEKFPFLLSTKDFEYISDLFKDISEVLSRQLVVVAGMNNLIKRNDHNKFEVVLSVNNKRLEPRSLKDYADLDFGKKMSFIDTSWLPISSDIADNQLRNSTAHFKWEYDSSTQVIKYYPKKEGLERSKSNEIYLIDYCKKVIDSFRVFHKLNFLLHTLNLKALNKI